MKNKTNEMTTSQNLFSNVVFINTIQVAFTENKGLNSLTVSSRDIAAVFGKRHSAVLRDIHELPKDVFKVSNFESISYVDGSNRLQPAYNVTRHGFNMIIKSVGKKDIYESKKLFMSAFDEAEEAFRKYKETTQNSNETENSNEIIINSIPVVFKEESDIIYVSSRDVASVFEKNHRDILRIIKDLPNDDFTLRNFAQRTYTTTRGNTYSEYRLTRDGFSMLVMGFTGQKAYEWKKSFIQAFNKMEQALKQGNVINNVNSSIESLRLQLAIKEAEARIEEAKLEQLRLKLSFKPNQNHKED